MHYTWTEIENFHTVRKSVKAVPHIVGNRHVVEYRAKVKLHGTNAGVLATPSGKVQAFSRTSVITPDCDNAGFAKWLEERKELFAQIAKAKNREFVVYGEWCGPGVQKGVACSQIPERVFAVFAVRFVDGDKQEYENEPCELASFVDGVPGAYVIPWYRDAESVFVDYRLDAEALGPVLEKINGWVAEIEGCDPWIKATFNVEGTGEGLVFYPCRPHGTTYEDFSNVCFKAKGEKHRVIAHSKPVQADATVVASAKAFAELVLPEARLVQGAGNAQTRDGRMCYDPRDLGNFIAWINKDVNKECQAELEAAGLTWKDAGKEVTAYARRWFLEKAKST